MPAYYRRAIAEFLQASPSEVLGELTSGNRQFGFSEVEGEAIDAWQEEIIWLKDQLTQLSQSLRVVLEWGLLLEFPFRDAKEELMQYCWRGNSFLYLSSNPVQVGQRGQADAKLRTTL
jgi:hypothetical protein